VCAGNEKDNVQETLFKKLKIEKLEITSKELIRGFINVKLKEI